MKAFSCSPNVKLCLSRSCIVWELTLINVNPHQIIEFCLFVYGPHLDLSVGTLVFPITPSHEK